MGGRIDIEDDDVGELGGKAGIARVLEGTDAVRLLECLTRLADGLAYYAVC
jgi:hypothetical protein